MPIPRNPKHADEAEHLVRIESLDRAVAVAAHHWAVFCAEAGRPGAAIAYLERAAEFVAHPALEADVRLNLGRLNEHIGDFESAVFHYDRGCRLETSDEHARYFLPNNLAYSLNQLGHFAASEAYCLRAIHVSPERHNAHKNLGVSLEGQGKPAHAATSYLRAAEIAPGDPRALAHLESLLERHPELAEKIS